MKTDKILKCAEIIFDENDPLIGCIEELLNNAEQEEITINDYEKFLGGARDIEIFVRDSGYTTYQIITENFPEKTEQEIALMFKTVDNLCDKMLDLEIRQYKRAYLFILNVLSAEV